ncbi:MAG: zinc ribbon domain-containing protein, partial [Chloroflexi bacterium]|nr:zinc ribbon domain-containing protein [Chloroflexota bacterium]
MPVYEYFCPNCEAKFELLRPMSCADQDATCSQCNSRARRMLSTFSAFNKSGDSGSAAPIAGAGGGCSGC